MHFLRVWGDGGPVAKARTISSLHNSILSITSIMPSAYRMSTVCKSSKDRTRTSTRSEGSQSGHTAAGALPAVGLTGESAVLLPPLLL